MIELQESETVLEEIGIHLERGESVHVRVKNQNKFALGLLAWIASLPAEKVESMRGMTERDWMVLTLAAATVSDLKVFISEFGATVS